MSQPKTKFFVESIPLVEEKASGVSHALAGLVGALIKDPNFTKNYEIVLVAPKRGLHKLDRWPDLKHCTRKGLPLKMRILSGLMKFRLLPPMDLLLGRGVYLFGNFKNWPVTKKSVSFTYLHDICFALHPDFVSPPLQKMLMQKMPKYMAQTDYVIAVSEASRQEIIDHYKLPPEKIVVLYNGVDRSMYYPRSQKEVDATTKRYGIKTPYYLAVGNIEPRKNLKRLVTAYATLPHDTTLVLVGADGWLNQDIWTAIEEAKAAGAYIMKPKKYVSDDDVAALMTGAIALPQVSIHEGFGMPPAEALSTQTPVVCSDLPVLHEVVGDAGIYCDQYDIDAIAEALTKARKLSPGARKKLADAGIKRVEKFNWQASAAKLVHILGEKK